MRSRSNAEQLSKSSDTKMFLRRMYSIRYQWNADITSRGFTMLNLEMNIVLLYVLGKASALVCTMIGLELCKP